MWILPILLLFWIFASCSNPKRDGIPEVYRTDRGFAYRISASGKIIVKQEYVPAVAGDQPFCDSTDAMNVARLVSEKITSGQNPAVTFAEIDSLQIKIGCSD